MNFHLSNKKCHDEKTHTLKFLWIKKKTKKQQKHLNQKWPLMAESTQDIFWQFLYQFEPTIHNLAWKEKTAKKYYNKLSLWSLLSVT